MREMKNRIKVLKHHEQTISKRNALQEKLVDRYFSLRKAAQE
jgi:hypothetical protein